MKGLKILTSIFLVIASCCSVSGDGAVTTIRIGGGEGGSDNGTTIRIGGNAMRINGPAKIIVCNAKGAHGNSSIKPRVSSAGAAKPEASLEDGLGAIFGLMEGFAKVAEGLDESLNNNGSTNPQFNEDNPIGGLFGLMAGLAQVAEGLDKGLNADECSTKTKKKCERKGGKCQSSSSCNGKVIRNGCEGSCTCCAPPSCSKADGFFKIRGSDQCFKAYTEESTYFDEAVTICQNDGLYMAEPIEDITPKLQRYLKNTYGGMFSSYWLNGRGNGNSILWQRSGGLVAAMTDNLWWPDEPAEDEFTKDHCLYMTVWDHALESHPGRPFLSGGCSWKPRTPLCELIVE